MAPNRRNIASLVETLSSNDLASLQSTVQPKFLPLTDPREQQEVSVVQQKPQAETQSYWDWSSDDVKEEVDLFSASHFVSNLISDAAVKVEESVSQTVATNDDYWAEESTSIEQEPVKANKPQHVQVSYWDWEAEQDNKKNTIDRILDEEKAYQLVSVATTEVIERCGALAVSSSKQVESQKESNDSYWAWESNVTADHVLDTANPKNNYWDWNNDEKPNPLRDILEYESAREFLTAENVVRQLQTRERSGEESCTVQANDGYWTWSECHGDQYWNEAAPAIVSSGSNYWDW